MHPRRLALGIIPLLSAQVAWAQAPETAASRDESIIEVTGHASESVPPDAVTVRFRISSIIQTSPDVAAEDVNGKATAVVAALNALGITDAEVSRIGYVVGPHWEIDDDGNRGFKGYSAYLTVRIVTSELAATGRIAQAGITGGAREISAIDYTSSEIDEARRSALRGAATAARLDAAAIADAAGGTLGRLLILTTQSLQAPSSLVRSFGGGPISTEITPEALTVRAQVNSRWVFVEAGE